ncbi:type VII secretion protein EccB [Streptomyces poonensis]|uniref:Type VII secretion protein EccB n=1 Tax=Streptomyces poonensis TaxID=68255 RepID=A0A918PED3_9ACTN|nr:type VII secretion protein EccB [Streptomyces poonensis]GGZ00845.1 type VII secretion protein EccB [Streptomyces poonensis]GLJ90427.1 type VII secretion protein EccB [Streptomyces poonensis]
MQSKRDQVQAHMFVMGRLTSGMLRADPDAPESPQGRTNRGIVIGIVVAVLLSAGAFVLGLLRPGTTDSWREAGTLVVDEETGTSYLYLNGRLRPVRNYASARLLAGADMKTVTVGTASLKGTPHGTPVGITGAPESLPAAGDLDTGPWQVCTDPASGGVVLAVGPHASDESASGEGLGGEEALLVTGPDKADYLIWRGSRLRLDDAAGAAESLGYGDATRVRVSAAFLNALPAGPDLTPPEVPGIGGEGPSLSGRQTRIGEVFTATVPGSESRYYLLRREGLVPVTATEAALALGSPETRRKVYGDASATAAELGAEALATALALEHANGSADSAAAGRLPASPPRMSALGTGQVACVQVEAGERDTRISVALVDREALGPTAQAPVEGLVPACVAVDRITVRPGGGALVHALGADGRNVGGTVYLVTDTGMKYRVSGADALEALGYTEDQARRLPATLLSMLPTGPDLTRTSAETGRGTTTRPPCQERDESGAGTGESATAPDTKEKAAVGERKVNSE